MKFLIIYVLNLRNGKLLAKDIFQERVAFLRILWHKMLLVKHLLILIEKWDIEFIKLGLIRYLIINWKWYPLLTVVNIVNFEEFIVIIVINYFPIMAKAIWSFELFEILSLIFWNIISVLRKLFKNLMLFQIRNVFVNLFCFLMVHDPVGWGDTCHDSSNSGGLSCRLPNILPYVLRKQIYFIDEVFKVLILLVELDAVLAKLCELVVFDVAVLL